MTETHARSVVKAFSWRAVATATTMALVFIFTGSLTVSLGVGVADVTSKLVFYYIHERVWNQVDWGKA